MDAVLWIADLVGSSELDLRLSCGNCGLRSVLLDHSSDSFSVLLASEQSYGLTS